MVSALLVLSSWAEVLADPVAQTDDFVASCAATGDGDDEEPVVSVDATDELGAEDEVEEDGADDGGCVVIGKTYFWLIWDQWDLDEDANGENDEEGEGDGDADTERGKLSIKGGATDDREEIGFDDGITSSDASVVEVAGLDAEAERVDEGGEADVKDEGGKIDEGIKNGEEGVACCWGAAWGGGVVNEALGEGEERVDTSWPRKAYFPECFSKRERPSQ